jgi:hypothetical protein
VITGGVVAQVPAELADRLYAAYPDAFVAERDQAVADAREAGDRELAGSIAKLRKPTVAAWLVNLLALRRPDLVADLSHLAGQLRDAQRELRGDELRELSAQRRAVVSALVEQARAVAVTERPDLARGKLPLADVESTLTAALADEEVAGQVRSGRLVRTVEYTGFGEVPRPRLRLVAEGAPPTEVSRSARRGATRAEPAGQAAEAEQAEQAEARRRAEAERAAEEASAGQRAAGAELDRATAAEEDGARVLAEAEAELAEAQRRRAAAEEELSRRKLARKAAERGVATARRRLGEAQAALEALDGAPRPERGSV